MIASLKYLNKFLYLKLFRSQVFKITKEIENIPYLLMQVKPKIYLAS